MDRVGDAALISHHTPGEEHDWWPDGSVLVSMFSLNWLFHKSHLNAHQCQGFVTTDAIAKLLTSRIFFFIIFWVKSFVLDKIRSVLLKTNLLIPQNIWRYNHIKTVWSQNLGSHIHDKCSQGQGQTEGEPRSQMIQWTVSFMNEILSSEEFQNKRWAEAEYWHEAPALAASYHELVPSESRQ